MFLKALTLIVFIAAVAVVLLGFRQQRLEMMNEMARLHGKMNQSRQTIWSLQIQIATKSDPPALVEAIERAQLKLESTTSLPGESGANSVGSPSTVKNTTSPTTPPRPAAHAMQNGTATVTQASLQTR